MADERKLGSAEQQDAYAGKRIAVVTGGNKGVGYAQAQVDFMVLDVASEESVTAFARAVTAKYGRLDYLINNAGVLVESGSQAEMARQTLAVNFYGVERMCRHLAPLVAKSDRGRIVNVASQLGVTRIVAKPLRARVVAKDLRTAGAMELAKEFLDAAASTARSMWPRAGGRNCYCVSKMLAIAYTKALARELARVKSLQVIACCPGWCDTDMSKHRGPRTPLKGADTPVWLCVRDGQPSLSGHFLQDRREHPW